ncbi:MAG: BatA domain-containing protein, partial [Gammaproteobacteria bacterium]
MSFGLLTPLFLAGIAAIAIPLIVHLVRREEHTSFAFPSLMFLESIPVREHRRRTIRHWWLLALRCLIIALLCLAFAQPFIEWPMQITGASNDSRDRVVLLDRSHSMQAGSRFDNARGLARKAIDELKAGDRAALVLFDDETLVTQKLTRDQAELRTALAAARTGHSHTDINSALSRASALLEKSDAAIREIVLISDFQRTGAQSREQARIASGIDIVPLPVTGIEQANGAVTSVE